MLCPLCQTPSVDSATTCQTCGGPLSSAANGAGGSTTSALAPGTKLQNGAYSLGKVLGQGGFGITYLGADTRLGRALAIKEFFPLSNAQRQSTLVRPAGSMSAADFKIARDKFLDEARVLARFNHSGIVNVFTSFEENNTAYMTMELLRGQTLLQLIETQGVLPEAEVVSIAGKVGHALETVHAAGVLHRDIKPDNILVCDDGRVVLLDFGTAREFAAGQTRRMTTVLTFGYAPLEQYTQSAKFGAPTDVYALGATLYHALTGECPMPATDRATGVALSPPHRMRQNGQFVSVSRTVSDAIMWALEINVANRPQTIRDFVLALRSTKTSPPQNRGGRGSGGRSVLPSLGPSSDQNPHLPRIQQIVAELARPTPVPPPSPHEARISEIAARLNALSSFVSPPETQCPACRKNELRHVPLKNTPQECPLCRTGRLQVRQLNQNGCPVCRVGRLQEYHLQSQQLCCPLCKISPLREEHRKKFGFALDLWLSCPTCNAQWDVLSGNQAKLKTLGNNTEPAAQAHLNETRTIAMWKVLSGRADRILRCPACAAQFDAPDDEHVTLAYCPNDPYAVGQRYLNKTFFRHAWAKVAHDLPLGAGNMACSGCSAEWQFDAATQNLRLLQGDTTHAPWAQSYQSRPIPVTSWYFMMSGKQSQHPGWLCSSCQTEWDDVDIRGVGRLVRTRASTLSPCLHQTRDLEDWHRIARNLIIAAEEQRERATLLHLQNIKQQEQSQWHTAYTKEITRLESELATLIKSSCIGGYASLELDRPSTALQPNEIVCWKSTAQMFRQRTQEYVPYWDLERGGTLVVTNQRILFEDAPYVETWSRRLRKLTDIELVKTSSLVSLSFEGLKKPVGFVVNEMESQTEIDGRSYSLTFSGQDLLRILKRLIS